MDFAAGFQYQAKHHFQELLTILDGFFRSIDRDHIRQAIGKDLLQHLVGQKQRILSGLDSDFTIAVIGDFKRGKSTLVNALLGRELVTSDVVPETRTINEIRYGKQLSLELESVSGERTALAIGDLKRERLEPILEAMEVPPLGLRLGAPVPWLKNICLVDTPGTGEILWRFDRRVQEYLSWADVVLVVVSALSPLSESETQFIKLSIPPRDMAKVHFVINMTDKLPKEDAERLLDWLANKIGRIFPGASSFALSALDELCRLTGETRPEPEQAPDLTRSFDAFRANLDESILLNRD